jgi:hypothetical protein
MRRRRGRRRRCESERVGRHTRQLWAARARAGGRAYRAADGRRAPMDAWIAVVPVLGGRRSGVLGERAVRAERQRERERAAAAHSLIREARRESAARVLCPAHLGLESRIACVCGWLGRRGAGGVSFCVGQSPGCRVAGGRGERGRGKPLHLAIDTRRAPSHAPKSPHMTPGNAPNVDLFRAPPLLPFPQVPFGRP